MKKPVLVTARLELFPFEMKDLSLLHKTFTDPFVRKYLWDNEIISHEQSRNILEVSEEFLQNEGWGLWKVMTQDKREYVGFVGLWKFFEEQQPQLLFGLLPAYTGKGYATESSKAIVDYAFSTLRYKHLIASFDNPNTASEKVCQRIGMRKKEEKEINDKPTVFYTL